MAKFTTRLDVRLKYKRDDVWILNSPLVCTSDLVGRIVVPMDFETDLASVPRVPFIYSMLGARAHREAVIHDYLFRKGSKPLVGFWTANRVFLELMKYRGKSFYIRYPMFWGVCIGAYGCFHKRDVSASL